MKNNGGYGGHNRFIKAIKKALLFILLFFRRD
jgi:hypothetical protein